MTNNKGDKLVMKGWISLSVLIRDTNAESMNYAREQLDEAMEHDEIPEGSVMVAGNCTYIKEACSQEVKIVLKNRGINFFPSRARKEREGVINAIEKAVRYERTRADYIISERMRQLEDFTKQIQMRPVSMEDRRKMILGLEQRMNEEEKGPKNLGYTPSEVFGKFGIPASYALRLSPLSIIRTESGYDGLGYPVSKVLAAAKVELVKQEWRESEQRIMKESVQQREQYGQNTNFYTNISPICPHIEAAVAN